MVEPIDIAEAAHRICVKELIPNKISPPHDETLHTDTSKWYADAINEAGLDVTGEEIVKAIITLNKWDKKSKWAGHPGPARVVERLKK